MAMAKKDEILQQEIEGFFCLSAEESSEENNDLSYWEFINPSDADSGDDIDIDNLSFDSFQNGLFASWQSSLSASTPPENQTPNTRLDDVDLDHRFVADDPSVGYFGKQLSYEEEDEDEEEEYEYDDDDDGDDVDDELVPWSVSGKLGRQRMRKLGKRAFAKMNYSKKSPVWYMKPGCVHGKHGLGLKHSC